MNQDETLQPHTNITERLRQIHLLALDLDGTLLTNDKRITERTRDALLKAHTAGIETVIVTGRPFHGLPDELEAFPGIRYTITSNGAVTTDLQTGDILRGSYIDRKVTESIVRIPIEYGLIYNVFINGCGYCDPETYQRLIARFRGTPLEAYVRKCRAEAKNILELIRESEAGIENIWIMAKDIEQRNQINSKIINKWHLRTVLTGKMDVEAGAPDADKGIALTELASFLRISRQGILAIGDHENDLGMLSDAGLSVAMGNATPSVKQAASFITDSNESDGVAKVIEQLLRSISL